MVLMHSRTANLSNASSGIVSLCKPLLAFATMRNGIYAVLKEDVKSRSTKRVNGWLDGWKGVAAIVCVKVHTILRVSTSTGELDWIYVLVAAVLQIRAYVQRLDRDIAVAVLSSHDVGRGAKVEVQADVNM